MNEIYEIIAIIEKIATGHHNNDREGILVGFLLVLIIIGRLAKPLVLDIYSLISFMEKKALADFELWDRFKQKWVIEKYEQAKLFEQELLIKTVKFIDAFKPNEINVILNLNISHPVVRNLNLLRKRNFVFVSDSRLHIISKKKLIRDMFFENVFLFILLLVSASCYIYVGLHYSAIYAILMLLIFSVFYTVFLFKIGYYSAWRFIKKQKLDMIIFEQ